MVAGNRHYFGCRRTAAATEETPVICITGPAVKKLVRGANNRFDSSGGFQQLPAATGLVTTTWRLEATTTVLRSLGTRVTTKP